MTAPRRILFVSEAITLAQVVRLATLARGLDRRRYEVHFASSDFPAMVFSNLEVRRWPVYGLAAHAALKRLARGQRLYTRRTLARYIEADRQVIEAVRPALIIGDLRWSLAVSAPASGVPCAALINAYWSPHAERDGFPVPDHPLVRLFGEAFVARYFPVALPWVFRHFITPLNVLRRKHGLCELSSLLDVLCFGDHTLYADPPGLVPMRTLPERHVFLGPILWSASGPLPAGWGSDPRRVPIYVTLGSSGAERCLPTVLAALAMLPTDVLLSTAGRPPPKRIPGNVRVQPYVDGAAACARARLVIHNGGSSTGYQALSHGVPVLGVCSNLDQFLASRTIETHGAGLSMRASGLCAQAVTTSVRRLLDERRFSDAAGRLARLFAAHDAPTTFARWLDAQFGERSVLVQEVPHASRDTRQPDPERARG